MVVFVHTLQLVTLEQIGSRPHPTSSQTVGTVSAHWETPKLNIVLDIIVYSG